MSSTNYNLYVDWNNDGDFGDADENITSYVQKLEWERGRDLANNLTGEYVSGILRVTLKNTTNIFSSFNSGSDLYGNILPSRKIKLQMGGGSTLSHLHLIKINGQAILIHWYLFPIFKEIIWQY